ncbi:MAG: T9SS type A sorting domain-containing protein [Paludibacter sp.]|jgi:hypothetical protein|nr:T9SS type A sorting domain-containing protein [Paludibacter sp.]
MSKYQKIILVFTILATSMAATAQLAMGGWRTHFSYNSIEKLAFAENKVFALTSGALMAVDQRDESLKLYSKITGLNDNNIQFIACDKQNSKLLIVYNNGNIDVMLENSIINIPDFYLKQSTASKHINHILFADNMAYLSTDFGILLVNMKKYEIAETFYIGSNGVDVKVLATAVLDSKIYAISENNIYFADKNSPNLNNYETWQILPQPAGSIANNNKIFTFGNRLFLHNGVSLFYKDINTDFTQLANLTAQSVFENSGQMIVKTADNQLVAVNQNFEKQNLNFPQQISDAYYDATADLYWFATSNDGVVKFAQNTSTGSILNSFKPDGPAANIPYELSFAGQKLFMVNGGVWDRTYDRAGYVSIFENNKWTIITPEEIEQKTGQYPKDFMNVAVDNENPTHFFVTSFASGLYEFENNQAIKRYHSQNSILQTVPGYESQPTYYTWLNGAIFDAEGNLFVVNMNVQANFKIKLKNGNWTQLAYPGGGKQNFSKLLISNRNPNQKWVMSMRYAPGIMIFDDGGTLSNQSDDRSAFINTFTDDEHQIIPANYYSMAQDKNGTIWIGTEQGPLIFANLENVFEPGYTCSRIKIPRNNGTNNADYLLQSEKITAIAIDGGNRKWLGTANSGVYLLSENGIETIRHFTAENSPLPSNNILSIAINPVSGEVFFGTENGLISYQSDASESNNTFDNLHVYPNPVRPQHKGMITVSGLLPDTRVKITDITGNLIYETTSNGSIAVWDGKNLYGNRVATGIYLAICVTEDGSQSSITKIMVIN